MNKIKKLSLLLTSSLILSNNILPCCAMNSQQESKTQKEDDLYSRWNGLKRQKENYDYLNERNAAKVSKTYTHLPFKSSQHYGFYEKVSDRLNDFDNSLKVEASGKVERDMEPKLKDYKSLLNHEAERILVEPIVKEFRNTVSKDIKLFDEGKSEIVEKFKNALNSDKSIDEAAKIRCDYILNVMKEYDTCPLNPLNLIKEAFNELKLVSCSFKDDDFKKSLELSVMSKDEIIKRITDKLNNWSGSSKNKNPVFLDVRTDVDVNRSIDSVIINYSRFGNGKLDSMFQEFAKNLILYRVFKLLNGNNNGLNQPFIFSKDGKASCFSLAKKDKMLLAGSKWFGIRFSCSFGKSLNDGIPVYLFRAPSKMPRDLINSFEVTSSSLSSPPYEAASDKFEIFFEVLTKHNKFEYKNKVAPSQAEKDLVKELALLEQSLVPKIKDAIRDLTSRADNAVSNHKEEISKLEEEFNNAINIERKKHHDEAFEHIVGGEKNAEEVTFDEFWEHCPLNPSTTTLFKGFVKETKEYRTDVYHIFDWDAIGLNLEAHRRSVCGLRRNGYLPKSSLAFCSYQQKGKLNFCPSDDYIRYQEPGASAWTVPNSQDRYDLVLGEYYKFNKGKCACNNVSLNENGTFSEFVKSLLMRFYNGDHLLKKQELTAIELFKYYFAKKNKSRACLIIYKCKAGAHYHVETKSEYDIVKSCFGDVSYPVYMVVLPKLNSKCKLEDIPMVKLDDCPDNDGWSVRDLLRLMDHYTGQGKYPINFAKNLMNHEHPKAWVDADEDSDIYHPAYKLWKPKAKYSVIHNSNILVEALT